MSDNDAINQNEEYHVAGLPLPPSDKRPMSDNDAINQNLENNEEYTNNHVAKLLGLPLPPPPA